LLQAIDGIRSERMLLEPLVDNLSFRCFGGLNSDDPVWRPTAISNSRDRLLNEALLAQVLEPLLAADRFNRCCVI